MSFFSPFIKALLLITIFEGCSVKEVSPLENIRHIDALKKILIQLDKRVDREEAKNFARDAILYAQQLSKEYKLVSPPYLQNTLVNFGLKERGLCYEWTIDMLNYLSSKGYKTLVLHKVGANIGSLREHNALSVSFSKDSINKSILLDAWRNSGNLYFITIEKDKKYRWRERFYR